MRVTVHSLGTLAERVCPRRAMLDREVLWRAAATFAVAGFALAAVFGK